MGLARLSAVACDLAIGAQTRLAWRMGVSRMVVVFAGWWCSLRAGACSWRCHLTDGACSIVPAAPVRQLVDDAVDGECGAFSP